MDGSDEDGGDESNRAIETGIWACSTEPSVGDDEDAAASGVPGLPGFIRW